MDNKISTATSKKSNPTFALDFGSDFGGNMSYDEWDILLAWTWFQSHARGNTQKPALTLWGHPQVADNGTNGASSSRAKWSLHYNLIDLEMGRAFWVGKQSSLRPFFGLRGAWIDQHFDIHYKYETTPSTRGKIRADSDLKESVSEGVSICVRC